MAERSRVTSLKVAAGRVSLGWGDVQGDKAPADPDVCPHWPPAPSKVHCSALDPGAAQGRRSVWLSNPAGMWRPPRGREQTRPGPRRTQDLTLRK